MNIILKKSSVLRDIVCSRFTHYIWDDCIAFYNSLTWVHTSYLNIQNMYPPMKLVLCLVTCSIIKSLHDNKSQGYMSSQKFYKELSRINNDSKNTYKPSKNTCGGT